MNLLHAMSYRIHEKVRFSIASAQKILTNSHLPLIYDQFLVSFAALKTCLSPTNLRIVHEIRLFEKNSLNRFVLYFAPTERSGYPKGDTDRIHGTQQHH